MRSRLMVSALCALAIAPFAFGSAEAQTRTRVGMLACDVSAGIGLVVGSQRTVACSFTPAAGGRRQTYVGRITRFGLDLGVTGGGELLWAVYAPTDSMSPSQLAGTYAGAGAEASVAVGLGANVLVGGSQDTVALQPVSVQAQTGVNLAIGVTGLGLAREVSR
jgi:hypothetical protein